MKKVLHTFATQHEAAEALDKAFKDGFRVSKVRGTAVSPVPEEEHFFRTVAKEYEARSLAGYAFIRIHFHDGIPFEARRFLTSLIRDHSR